MYPRAVRPFSLEGLPRLPRAAVRTTRLFAQVRAALPDPVEVPLARVGQVRIRATRLAFAPPTDEGAAFALQVRGARARLTIEPWLALHLVAAVLGLPPPLALRPLGRTERGVLAAAVVGVLEGAGAGPWIRLALGDAEAGPVEAGDLLAIELRVQFPGFAGGARLDLPAHLLAAPAGRLALDAHLLAPMLSVELARTTLQGGALTSAAPGDTVVFDGATPAGDGPWPVQVRMGACWFPAQLTSDGNLQRHGPLCHESETRMTSEDANITAPVPSIPLSDDASRALAAAPVEIVAELGRLTVRGDELAGLVDGGVLALGPRRPAQVVLRVGGRVWAHGELVAIDDELGVRITELVK
jgi:flagellar motor switch protein FliN/FliY